jgi:hypothetical protein
MNTSLNIDSVRAAISKWEIQIKKGEWITHALMRFIDDGKDNNKEVWALNTAFKKLNNDNQKEIIALAREIEKNAPFTKRNLNQGYKVTKVDDVLSLAKSPESIPSVSKIQPIDKKERTAAAPTEAKVPAPVISITPVDRAIIEKTNNTNIAPIKNIPVIPAVIASPPIDSTIKVPPVAPKTQPLPRDPSKINEDTI